MVEENVKRLCAIYTLPWSLGWVEDTAAEGYTACQYWRRLELLDQDQLDTVFLDKRVVPNQVIEQFFRNMDRHFHPESYRGHEVADVGSGFGFMTMWMVLNGAARVHTIGDSVRMDFIQRLYSAAVEHGLLPADKLAFRGDFVRVGDTTLSPTIVPGSLALVLLTDTLEHITPRLLPSLATAAYNDLQPGGVFMSKQQNTDSRAMIRRLRPTWETIERTYTLPQRRRLIEEEFPEAVEVAVEELSQRTRGLDSIGFRDALSRFKMDASMPSHDLNVPPIDVLTDVAMEGDTGITRVMSVFEAAGYGKRTVYPDLMSMRRSRPFQGLAKLFPSLFFSTHMFDETTVFVMRK